MIKIEKEKTNFFTLWEIVKILRSEKGCPWDKKQTPYTLKKYLLEEVYEVLEAIEKGKSEEIREELGDLLFLIIFIIYLYEEMNLFTLKDLFYYTSLKMIKRHPHVFEEEKIENADEIILKWQKIKKKEGKEYSILGNLPKSLPALQRAFRIGERAGRVNFDWEKAEDVLKKIEEEIEEIKNSLKNSSKEKLKEEIGDLLFSIANFSRKLNINPEEALKLALEKFEKRFKLLEQEIEKKGLSWEKLTINELDQIWDKIKSSYEPTNY